MCEIVEVLQPLEASVPHLWYGEACAFTLQDIWRIKGEDICKAWHREVIEKC